MRKMFVVIAAATAILAAASMVPTGAGAAPLSGVAGLGGALAESDATTPVNYACSRVWRCGPFGCGFRSVCGWRPGYGFDRPHRAWAYNPYWGSRPHWRPHWRGW